LRLNSNNNPQISQMATDKSHGMFSSV
jgi:hypothetical protein